MVNFGGWDMPVEYPSSGGLVAEHKAVRGSVGVFDVSHMGDIRVGAGRTAGGALAAVLLASGLKLVNVPTLAIGIVLLVSVLVLGIAWAYVRASGRTLREISGEAPEHLPGPHAREFAEEPTLQAAEA